MDVERALISKAAQTGEIELLVSRGIEEDHFSDPECEQVYATMLRHVRKYKTPPSLNAIKQRHKKFEFELTSDSIDYLVDEFYKKVKRRLGNQMILDLSELADDPDKAADIDIHFLDAARQLATIVPSTEVARFSDMGKRIETYEEDKLRGDVWGIRMGLPPLDEKTFGIQPHELVICAGWQGRGKSTLMQHIGFNAYLQDKKVLFISLEMEHKALLRKFDTMAVDMKYADLKSLKLGDESVERWQQWADQAGKDRDERDIIIIDRIGSRTPAGIFAETVRHKPDLVIVDYLSLLDAPKSVGDKSWQQIGHISRELKLNAQTLGVPVIAAAQTNRESTKEGVKLETIAFSSSIGMDADIVLGLNQDDEQKDNKQMEVVMPKSRDSAGGKCLMDWDMETMQFGHRSAQQDRAFSRKEKKPKDELDEAEETEEDAEPERRSKRSGSKFKKNSAQNNPFRK